MATNAFTGTSLSMRSVIPQTQAFASISGPTSASISSFGRKNVSFSLQPRLIRLKISCAAAKPETVEKVCKIVKKQLAMPETDVVTGESKFATLGADSLDTVIRNIMPTHNIFPFNVHFLYLTSYMCHDT
ncbi:Acyl carrier protein 1, chloroplastic isoform A [Glycine soja]|uniref:Carrier domain-containing protein n=2 Tax=Glycine subgen. Soja TaxID=1462606 RepID=I1JRI3_SOYBN|nr:Acyl carrier protein 1, chloroplastic isoform A [Glycine soja]